MPFAPLTAQSIDSNHATSELHEEFSLSRGLESSQLTSWNHLYNMFVPLATAILQDPKSFREKTGGFRKEVKKLVDW